MKYQVGDKVIHWIYGLGEVLQIDEKTISGRQSQYYVVQVRDLTLWVQANETGEQNLRSPTPSSEFPNIIAILSSPAEELSADRLERRQYVITQIRDGSLASICRVLRDLTFFCANKKINDSDKGLLESARNLLITEWKHALAVPAEQIEKELQGILSIHTHPAA